jgi:hypothetical protein
MIKYPNIPIAIDFDGTCVTHMYPFIGKDIGAAPVLKRLVKEGANLILWTMRSDAALLRAEEWFTNNGITLYGIQRNPDQEEWTKSPKAYAKIYIDDAALGCPLIYPDPKVARPYVDWKTVEAMLFPAHLGCLR